MTPDEMRALAERLAAKADWMLVFADTDEEVRLFQEAEAVLRDAVDRLDAVLTETNEWREAVPVDVLRAILTTPTTQEAGK